MKNIFLMYAKHMKRTDESILDIVNKVNCDARMKDRGSYFKNIGGILIHILGGTFYFLKLFNDAFENKKDILKELENIKIPDSVNDDASYEELKKNFSVVDRLSIALIESLTEEEINREMKINWYKGRPSVPFYFIFSQLIVTNIHHRGQLSQIFDEMKIEHDFSGIDVGFLE